MNNFQTPINPVLNTNRLFPQPQGTVYIIDNEAELNNIPVSSNLSVAIDTTSKVLYIKSMQNGAPTMLTYKLSEVNPMPTIEQLVQRISNIEAILSKNLANNTGDKKNESF